MLAHKIACVAEDGVASVDYLKADIPRGSKRKTRLRLTPSQKVGLRDKVWVILAREGLTTYEIAEACERAAQSERNIRRRLQEFAQQVDQAEAG